MSPKSTPVVLIVAALAVFACKDSTGPAPGALTVDATGMPAGAAAIIVVRGPDQYLDSLTTGQTIADLAAGTYEITARPALAGGDLYAPDAPAVTREVGGDHPSVAVTFAYALASGRLDVTIAGVPDGFTAPAVITGPNRYVQALPGDMIVRAIPAGEYVLTTAVIDSSGHTFAAATTNRPLTVTASTTTIPIAITYALATARTAVTITGLPPATPGAVTITGPGGYQTLVTTTDTLIQLAPGSYTVAPAEVAANGHTFAAPTYSVTLVPGREPVDAAVTYAQTTGTLIVNVTGLPANNPAAVSVQGPDTTRTLASTDTLIGVVQGAYTVRAPTLVTSGVEYVAADSVHNLNLAAAATEQVDIAYAFSGNATLNLSVANAYVVQAIQRPDGSVPLVAGRDGYLRVFVQASEANTMAPEVRARFFVNGVLSDSVTIPPPGPSVPTQLDERPIEVSWNVVLPGSLIVATGLAVQLEVDPDNLIPEADDTDNVFPAGGQPLALDVRTLGAFPLRLVPVIHGANQGNVIAANVDAYLSLLRKMYPLADETVELRAPFTSSAGDLESDDDNKAWTNTLNEIFTLRLADQSSSYYYGVVHANYASGIAGLAYIPSTPNSDFVVAVGWDHFPTATRVMAHELGHNFGRRHAPCGNPPNTDPAYPHPNADIGFFGVDVATATLKVPKQQDIMSYCTSPWVSDYTYEGILARREASVNGAPAASTAPAARSLLVWGRIESDRLVLEPAFEIVGRPHLPDAPGPYRLHATGPAGETVFDLSFEGVEVADLPGPPERHFAYLVPVGSMPITQLQLSGGGRRTVVRTGPDPAAAPPFASGGVALTAVDGQRVRVQWDAARHPMVMVRDRRTRDVLGFARGGSAVVWAESADLELVFSNGVGGPTAPARVPGRQ